MNNQTEALEQASIRQYCKLVRTPPIAANFMPLAEQAIREQHSHVRFLEALLAMECEERDRHAVANRIRDAQLPRMKTLEEFIAPIRTPRSKHFWKRTNTHSPTSAVSFGPSVMTISWLR